MAEMPEKRKALISLCGSVADLRICFSVAQIIVIHHKKIHTILRNLLIAINQMGAL